MAASVVTDRQTDEQTDKMTTVTLAHAPRVNKEEKFPSGNTSTVLQNFERTGLLPTSTGLTSPLIPYLHLKTFVRLLLKLRLLKQIVGVEYLLEIH